MLLDGKYDVHHIRWIMFASVLGVEMLQMLLAQGLRRH
jgi:hypothetical protein